MRTPRWLVASMLAAAAAAPLLLAPSEARAEWDPIMHRSDAGVDLYLWPARFRGTTTAAVPFIQFEPTPDLFINLKFPVAFVIDGPGDDAYFGLGNPTFGIHYSDISGKLTWNAGGRVSAPLASAGGNDWDLAMIYGASAMGLYDVYLWAYDTLPFGGYGGIEYRFADFFVLRAGGDLMFYPGFRRGRTLGGARGDDFDVVLQSKVEGEFQSEIGVGGGLALMGTWIPTASGDVGQILALPYFVYDSQETFFMRAGFLLALDRPLGPGFDRGGLAALYLQFGGHLD